MPDVTPCLGFRGEAEEAAIHYVSVFPNSRVQRVTRAGGQVVGVDFVLDGRPHMAINGRREAGFTDAVSLAVTCSTQDEVDRYWAALVAGGEEGQCGWLRDRYGVSWQVVPAELATMLGDPDPARAGRVLQAMLGMRKLDLAELRRARDGVAVGA